MSINSRTAPRGATHSIAVLLVLGACGRLRYDPVRTASSPDDAAADLVADLASSTDAPSPSRPVDSAEPDRVVPVDVHEDDGPAPADARESDLAARVDVQDAGTAPDARGTDAPVGNPNCSEVSGLTVCDVQTERKDFAAAQAFCAGLGLRLASVTSQAQHDAVTAWAQPRGVREVVLGGTDAKTEGDWVWSDGTAFWRGGASGQPVAGAFSRWGPGEPNDSGGTEDCLTLYVPGSTWNDVPCSVAFAGVACRP